MATSPELRAGTAPVRKHHIDRRAHKIIAAADTNTPDRLYSTKQLADWLGASTQFLEILRSKGAGPKFIRLAPRLIKYRHADIIEWLDARAHARTTDYAQPP